MKTKKILIILLVTFCISCEKESETNSAIYENLIQNRTEAMNMERPKDSYNYPIYPGMKEWETLTSRQEMEEACQVPESLLKTMSTQAVIQALWEYPLLLDIFHRFQYQMDFEGTFSQNNAYKELCNRTDAGISLLERLRLVNPLILEARFEFETLELLMAQAEFLSQLDMKEKKSIIEYALAKDNLRQQNVDFANKSERAIVWLLLGKVMLSSDYTPFIAAINSNEPLKLYITSNSYAYLNEVYGNIPQIIVKHAIKFI